MKPQRIAHNVRGVGVNVPPAACRAPHTPAASWPRVDTTTVPTTVAAAGGKRPASAPPPEPNAATPRRGSRQRGLPLRQLESHLGYSFSQPALLEQACTHSPDKQAPSYRQLAFLGDAALWLLFAEHAFHARGEHEDPVSGAWPAQLSALLSRASCAATARQWGLQQYLCDCDASPPPLSPSPSPVTRRSSSSSSNGSASAGAGSPAAAAAGMAAASPPPPDLTQSVSDASSTTTTTVAAVWGSDALAEMLEGVVGALLLDGGFDAVSDTLGPWVAEAFALSPSRQLVTAGLPPPPTPPAREGTSSRSGAVCATAAVALQQGSSSNSSTNKSDAEASQDDATAAAAAEQHRDGSSTAAAPSGVSACNGEDGASGRLGAAFAALLVQQLLARARFAFTQPETAAAAGGLLARMMARKRPCGAAAKLQFLGFAVLQFAAARRAYQLCGSSSNRWECSTAVRCRECPHWPTSSSCSSFSSSGSGGVEDDGCGSVSGSSVVKSTTTSSSSSSTRSGGDRGGTGGSPAAAAASWGPLQIMARRKEQLTSLRHRCRVWLWLGLDPGPLLPPESALLRGRWKTQKATLSRALDLVIGAAYVDGGRDAALQLTDALLEGAPLCGACRAWAPAWAARDGA